MFEDCDSTVPPDSSTASSLTNPANDPTEFAFSPRFSGAASPTAATSALGGGTPVAHPRDENHAYLEPIVAGEEMEEEMMVERGEEKGDRDGEGEYEARREAQLMMVESAASGAGGGGQGGEGKSGGTFLPTARQGGYSDAQLGRWAQRVFCCWRC